MKQEFIRFGVALISCSTLLSVSAAKIESHYGPASDKACGIEIVEKATEFRQNNDFAGGEQYLRTEASVEGRTSVAWQQCLDMARFALYREDKSKDAEMDALLNRVLAKGETNFWGTAALGWLHVRGKEPITAYWPWRKGQLAAPETMIVYGVDKAFKDGGEYVISIDSPIAVSAIELNDANGVLSRLTPTASGKTTEFSVKVPAKTVVSMKLFVSGVANAAGEMKIVRKIAKERRSVAFNGLALPKSHAGYYIRRTVGEATIKAIGEKEGGVEFLQQFFSDNDWVEQFAGSGPWSCQSLQGMNENTQNAAKALLALDTLVANDVDNFILGTKIGRNFATALALNHGYDRDDDWLVEVLACYRAWSKDGSLVPMAKDYDTRQWREVLGFGQNSHLTIDDLKWCHNFTSDVPVGDYGAMCWQCSYRTYNCFGESVQGPHYYRAWEHRMNTQEMRYYVGGVCGALSKFGSFVAASHGIRTTTAGQPQHCAYTLWDYAKNRWNIAYSVTGHTMPHNTLGGSGFAAVTEMERYYSHPRRMEAERLRWQGRYEQAMRLVPGNRMAAVAWYNRLVNEKGDTAAWNKYGAAVRETFRDMPSNAYQLYLPYLWKLPTRDERLAAAKAALETIVETNTDEVEAGYFEEIALNPLKDLFAKDEEAVWALFDSALEGQAATKTFYRQTVNWGATKLIVDDASTKRCMAAIGKSVRKSGAQIDYREMLVTAAKYGDIEMFRQVYDLLDKCSPELRTTADGRKWPTEKNGGVLISKDGMLMTSTTSGWDWPLSYRDALNAEGHVERNSFHTAREKAPWAQVKLPGPAEVKAITIVNSGAGGNIARQIPLVVWTSEDGKNFKELARFTTAQGEWEIQLAQPIKASYVRVGRVPDAKTEVFHLHKILVYGKNLY